MLHFELHPNQGIGKIKLGMDRTSVRKLMNLEFNKYKKTEDSLNITDAYLNNSFQIFYDTNDDVEFIELSYAPDLYDLNFKGLNLFEVKSNILINTIENEVALDEEASDIPFGYVFREHGISLWRPVDPDDYEDDEEDEEYRNGRYFMVIGVGTKDYFNDL